MLVHQRVCGHVCFITAPYVSLQRHRRGTAATACSLGSVGEPTVLRLMWVIDITMDIYIYITIYTWDIYIYMEYIICGIYNLYNPNIRFLSLKWVCLKIGYIPNYSHLIGIMISKTIGFRGTLFSDTPIYIYNHI